MFFTWNQRCRDGLLPMFVEGFIYITAETIGLGRIVKAFRMVAWSTVLPYGVRVWRVIAPMLDREYIGFLKACEIVKEIYEPAIRDSFVTFSILISTCYYSFMV